MTDIISVQGKKLTQNSGNVSIIGTGRQGPPGASGSSFEHIQSTPASTWVVNHNLGYRPNVSVKTPGGIEVMAEVLHVSINQVQIFFDSSATGIANFS